MSTCKRMWTDHQIRSMAVNSVEKKEDLEVFEHIVDKDGHPRFIEGDLSIEPGKPNLVIEYGKWSLSGTHLMIALAGYFKAGEYTASGKIVTADLPSWVYDKIQKVAGDYIEIKSVVARSSTLTNLGQVTFDLLKETKINIRLDSGYTPSGADAFFRVQFDLLIDNE